MLALPRLPMKYFLQRIVFETQMANYASDEFMLRLNSIFKGLSIRIESYRLKVAMTVHINGINFHEGCNCSGKLYLSVKPAEEAVETSHVLTHLLGNVNYADENSFG